MIKVLDYGSGNVTAITNIFDRLNIACELAVSKQDLEGAHKLILPGVGAFDRAMHFLRQSGMIEEATRLVVHQNVPVLGVCVGMQMMARSSSEGSSPGLGWIDGVVELLATDKLEHKPLLPHMGWNSITPQQDHMILDGIDIARGFYFLHSYQFLCNRSDEVLTTSTYGAEFTSAFVSDHKFGFQFHPEKSHQNGVNLFRNFASI